MSYAFNEDKSKMELDVVFSDINLNINGKADEGHTHAAADITDGTLDVARIPNLSTDKLTSGTLPTSRGGTGQTTLQATRNAMGLGNTTGALPVANGGTGQTTLQGLRNAAGLGNTTGAVPIANGGTGQTTAAAARNALGLGNTTGALPVANGGTGATTAAAARSNLAAAQKRNLTANYAGATTNNPDFLVKTFTGSFTTSSSSYSKDVGISVTNYLPIAIAGFNCHGANNSGYNAHAYFKNGTTVTVEGLPGSGFTVNYTVQVLYVRTAMINQ